jgi:hypothetical protein
MGLTEPLFSEWKQGRNNDGMAETLSIGQLTFLSKST